MTALEYLRDPRAPIRLRRACYELCEGQDALRAAEAEEEADLREQAESDRAEIPLRGAYQGT